MAQVTDYVIANGSGSAVRADINNVFAASKSSNSGTSAPSNAVAGTLWFDTSTSPATLKRLNAANTAWVEVSPDTVPANNLRGNPTGSAAAETNVTMAQLKTMLGYSTSLGANGYSITPGGTIFQWGTAGFVAPSSAVGLAGSLGTVTFPITFPTSIRNIQVVQSMDISTGIEATENVIGVENTTTSQAEFFALRVSGSQTGSDVIGIYWFAVGH